MRKNKFAAKNRIFAKNSVNTIPSERILTSIFHLPVDFVELLTINLYEWFRGSSTSLLGSRAILFRHLHIADYLVLKDGNLFLRTSEGQR